LEKAAADKQLEEELELLKSTLVTKEAEIESLIVSTAYVLPIFVFCCIIIIIITIAVAVAIFCVVCVVCVFLMFLLKYVRVDVFIC
jgi:hypothetical protein